MPGKRSLEALAEFLDYLASKGLMAKNTAHARKAAAGKVLGILSPEEREDVTAIDLDDVITRFGNLHGKQYTPQSMVTYKSRVRSALDDFDSYLTNPLAFRPSLQNRERKPKGGKGQAPATRQPSIQSHDPQPKIFHSQSGPMASSILPIPIRPDLTVHVQGLPYDLTEAEAKKIASVIQAMAMPT